jgi:hypothetical protein
MRLVALAITRTDNLLSPLFEGSLPLAGGREKTRLLQIVFMFQCDSVVPVGACPDFVPVLDRVDALESPPMRVSLARCLTTP